VRSPEQEPIIPIHISAIKMTSILDNMKHLPKGLPVRIEESTNIQKGILSYQFGGLYMQSSDGQVWHIRYAWNSFLKRTQTPDAEVLKNLPLENVLDHFYLDKKVDGFKVSLAQVLTWSVERIKSCHQTDVQAPFRQALHLIGHPLPVIIQGRDSILTVSPCPSDPTKGILAFDWNGRGNQIYVHPSEYSHDSYLETVVLKADKTLTLRAFLEWSATEIQAFLRPVAATCPAPIATATATFDQPWPDMPEELKRVERIHLSSLLDCAMTVYVEFEKRGRLEATLHPDGTFSYDNGEVGCIGLNSFELFWHYMRRFPQEKDIDMCNLETLIDVNSEWTLHFIHFHSDTTPLVDHVKNMFADMPPLVDASADIAIADPDPLCLLMARLEDKEAIYRRELRILTAIEEKQQVVKDLEAQVKLMRTRIGI